jgi:hypothetical protein
MMAATRHSVLEFVGGPFDGLRQVVGVPENELAATAAFPVNKNVFRILEGKRRGPRAETTSVAIYELEKMEQPCRYYYRGATSAERLHLDGWLV